LVFHTSDLANLWGIQNKNTLHKTISRYVQKGLMYRVYRGMFSITNPRDLNPRYLGIKAIHSLAYISCETVLYDEGIINQSPSEIMIVSSLSKHFTIAGNLFRSRRLRDEFLFNSVGITMKDGVRTASLPRAVADMLYFNRRKYFDAENSGLLKWNEVAEIANALGYMPESKNK